MSLPPSNRKALDTSVGDPDAAPQTVPEGTPAHLKWQAATAVIMLLIAAAVWVAAQHSPTAKAADEPAAASPGVPAGEFDHSHAAWNTVLQAHVHGDKFDYAALQADRAGFDAYLAALAAPTAENVKGWTRQQQVAYYINAYNAYTIESILAAYPIKRNTLTGLAFPANSIRQISGVWDTATHRVAGEDLTLDAIEHKRLREELNENRVHFAVNCASIGCPPLADTAMAADTVDRQLNELAKAFANNPDYVRYDAGKNTLTLSKILEWFGDDFAKTPGTADGFGKYNGVVNFLASRWSPATRTAVLKKKPKIVFADYDWALNDVKK